MQIGGTLVTALVRVLVVVATLAAAYYFLVRPILDTTEKVSSGINENIQRSLDQADKAFKESNVPKGTQVQITREIRNAPAAKARRMGACMRRNPTDLAHIQRCADRFTR